MSTERPESHPRDQVLAGITFACGVLALITGAIPDTHFIGAVLGAVALGVGAVSQLISVTTNERWFNVSGVIAGAVGLAFAISNGGFDL